jgi:hypothetical protein
MANVTITDLSAASALGGSELFETVQTGASVKTTATAIKTFANTSAVILGGTLTGVAINSSTITNAIITGSTYASLTINSATINNALATGGTYNSITLNNVTLSSGSVEFNTITGGSRAQLISTRDQTATSANVAYAVSFDTASSWNAGITMASSTNITFATAGVYLCSMNFQLANSDTSNHTVTVWYQKNGTNVANTGSTISVPKAADGGVTVFELTFQEQLTVGQYLTLYWATSSTTTKLDYTAASAGPPDVPAIPSVIFTAQRII